MLVGIFKKYDGDLNGINLAGDSGMRLNFRTPSSIYILWLHKRLEIIWLQKGTFTVSNMTLLTGFI
jgi:hypothetical protein